MSIKQLTVYNVYFGDCIDIELDNKEKLLVDCGSNFLGEKLKSYFKNIADDIMKNHNNNVKIVVTHFHEDHYNILKYFSESSIEEIYIPNFFTEEEIKLEFFTLLQKAEDNLIYQNAKKMLKLIPNLVLEKSEQGKSILKSKAMITFVKREDPISDDFTTLWPNIKEYTITVVLNKVKEELNNNKEIVSTIENFSKQYHEITEQIKQRLYLESNVRTLDVLANELQKIVEEAINFIERIDNIPKISRYIMSEIHNIQNEISVVFHKKDITSTADDCLFLGDIPSDIYEEYIYRDVCKKKYKCIKVAHHGSDDYFTLNLPDSEHLIISNGKPEHIKKGNTKRCPYISHQYPFYYTQRQIHCTNSNNCQFLMNFDQTKANKGWFCYFSVSCIACHLIHGKNGGIRKEMKFII